MVDTVDSSQQATQAPDKTDELWEGSAQRLQDALKKYPRLLHDVEDAVRQFDRKSLNGSSALELYSSIKLLCNDEQLALDIVNALRDFDNERFVDLMAVRLQPDVWPWLRRLMALYGRLVSESYAAAGERSDDWRNMQVRPLWDAATSSWTLVCYVTKFNGENFRLDTSINGILSFATNLLDALNAVPEDDCARELQAEIYSNFMQCSATVSEREPFVLKYELPPSLVEKLRQAGADDEATLATALECDPSLREDYEDELFRMLMKTRETRAALTKFWRLVPSSCEAQFVRKVEARIHNARETGGEELAIGLENRLRVLRDIQGEDVGS